MKFQKRQNTGTGSRSVVARGQRWGRQGGHEEIGGGVPEMFYIVSMVELMLLCAFAKTEIAA